MRGKKKEAKIEEKITFALEKLTQVNRILLWKVAKEEKLSPIQIQFLVYLNNHPEEFCKVSNLAEEFDLTEATVSEAIKSLKIKGFIAKRKKQKDGRVFILKLTLSGKMVAQRVSGWPAMLKKHLSSFPPQLKETVMMFLMELIKSLQVAGIISVARMCVTCVNFQRNAHPGSEKLHHCRLTNAPLADSELNMDCAAHRPKNDLK